MHRTMKRIAAALLAVTFLASYGASGVWAEETGVQAPSAIEEQLPEEAVASVENVEAQTQATSETADEPESAPDVQTDNHAEEDPAQADAPESSAAAVAPRMAANGVMLFSAGEQTFDISQGNIVIDGSQVTVGDAAPVTCDAVVITGTSEANTLTVKGDADVTIRDLSLSTSEEKSLIDLQGANITLRPEGENILSNAGGSQAVIHVSEQTSLTLEGQGSLTIRDGIEDGVHEANGAGIGGNLEQTPKAITIRSGVINVTQYGTAACIGGGARADSGKITIEGGTVSVWALPAGGDLESAGTGIGGGGENIADVSLIGSAGNADVTITGGKVTAVAKSAAFDFGACSSGAAIGSGENKGGSIYIGGTAEVDASAENAACAIGSSNATWSSSGSQAFPAPEFPMNITIEGNAVVRAQTKSLDFYGQGAYAGAAIGMSTQNLQPCTITIGGNANVTAAGSWYGAGIGGGYVQIESQAQPLKIHIKDEAVVNASAEVYGAAIGSGYGNSGAESAEILIEGNPTITANGGWGAAGIGGAKGTSGGAIRITGGTIVSRGGIGYQDIYGDIGGAGIGAGAVSDSYGAGGNCGSIYIGGTANVQAYGGIGSAGIGGGNIQAVTTTGVPSVKPNEDNSGGVESITIADTATVYAVGGQGAAAIGAGAAYEEAPAPVAGEISIAATATVEAYADGAKYAVDTDATVLNVANSLLNARFEEGANPADQEKKINVEIDNTVDRALTLPANYRSFATTTSIADENAHTVYVRGTEDCADEYAYYPDDQQAKIIVYPIQKDQMLVKDQLNWVKPIVVTPAELVIYMGGQHGYDGVVNENGQIQSGTDSLPEPGFYFSLSQELNNALKTEDGVTQDTALNLSNHLTLQAGNKSWKLELYGEEGASSAEGKNVYRILPAAEGQDPVRVQFTDQDGNVHLNDTFTIQDALYAQYTMAIYPGAVDQSRVMAVVDGDVYPVISRASTMTIRGVTQDGETTGTLTQKPDQQVEKATAVVKPGTVFTVNDSNVKVVDGDIHLLADSIVQAGNSKELLENRANEVLQASEEHRQYESFYLDLVDAANGNAWVTSSEPVTVYLPYPEGTDSHYSFRLVHFEGLDRDMTVGDLANQIAACNAQEITVETTDQGICFETDGFSPFVLTWQDSYTVTYQFQSGTQGAQLADTVTKLLPVDSSKYGYGTTVTPAALQTTRVEVSGGVWTFAGWDATSKVANGDLLFVGTWYFEPSKTEETGGGKEESSPAQSQTAQSTPAPSQAPQQVQTVSAVIPQTGDDFPVVLWIGLLLLSAAGLAGGWVLTRKKQ